MLEKIYNEFVQAIPNRTLITELDYQLKVKDFFNSYLGGRVHTIVCGGAACAQSLRDFFINTFQCKVFAGYGIEF